MKSKIKTKVKEYCRAALLASRGSTITQEQMAAKLGISVRAYQNLESGKSCIGIYTLCMYLLYAYPDRMAFVSGLFDLLDEIADTQKDVAA